MDMVRQLSIFLENKVGMLKEFAEIMRIHGFKTKGVSIADTTDFGILRLIVDDPDKAVETFRANGFTASLAKVVAFRVKDNSDYGKIFGLFAENGISIEYMYTISGKDNIIVLRVDDISKADCILKDKEISSLEESEIWG